MDSLPSRNKFKLVISDLHLGKGRILNDGSLNSLEEFYYGEKLVEFLHYYSSGPYRDVEIELIINGDFLNFLQIDYHGHFLTVITEKIALDCLAQMIEGHPQVFDALKEFVHKANHSITYVLGNHDQAMMFSACRNLLNTRLETTIKYKNLVYSFDGIHIEHGHMHEAANRLDPKKFFLKRNLPEPILNLPFGSYFFIELVLKIKEKYPHVDKIRPFSKMVRWAIINETGLMISSVTKLISYFLKNLFLKDPKRSWSLRRLFRIFLESAIFPDLSESAKRLLNDERIHTVIFGHSHVYQYRQWSSDKEYFNTGTWTEITSLDIVSFGKITKLTYVLLDYAADQKRPRGRLKEWRGYHRIEEDVAVS